MGSGQEEANSKAKRGADGLREIGVFRRLEIG